MTEQVITDAELQAEFSRIDAMREKQKAFLLTDEQFKILDYARAGEKPVTWEKLTQYFVSRWGDIKENTLKSRYRIDATQRGKN